MNLSMQQWLHKYRLDGNQASVLLCGKTANRANFGHSEVGKYSCGLSRGQAQPDQQKQKALQAEP